MNISWENEDSLLLANPSYSKEEHQRFQKILEAGKEWKGHIWLSTSGSSAPKWVGLSKKAILASASAVNQHLVSNANDVWINPLTHFHVGGLGIVARAHLSGASCHDYKLAFPGKWCAEEFYRYVSEMEGTLTSLVPAQLQDLVLLGLKAPKTLRAVIIGGGVTLPTLYEKAVELNWPILPSYGLTECASQVATAPLGSWLEKNEPSLRILPHLEASIREGNLCFAGPSLLSTYAYLHQNRVEFIDPKKEGWLKTEDRGAIENGCIKIFGRGDAVVKVGGENVDVARLENHLQALKLKMGVTHDLTLIPMSDPRLGHTIHLAAACHTEKEIAPLIEAFQTSVLPFEKIRKIHLVSHLPKSSIGKILKGELIKTLT